MKFGKRLQCEAGEDWADQYIAYTMLKRLIDKCIAAPDDMELRAQFMQELNANIDKIAAHFDKVMQELHDLHRETILVIVAPGGSESYPLLPSKGGKGGGGGDTFSSPTTTGRGSTLPPSSPQAGGVGTPKGTDRLLTVRGLFLLCIGERFFQRITPQQKAFRRVYRLALRLGRYADFNREGLRKVMKKYDKNLGTKETDKVLAMVDKKCFVSRRQDVTRIEDECTKEYHAQFGEPLQKYGEVEVQTGGQWHVKWRWLLLSFVFLFILLAIPMLPGRDDAHRCLAMIVCILTLWLTEAIPFFCTAMFIPLLAVWLQVIADVNSDVPLSPVDAAQLLLTKVFGHTQVLVLGGLVMAKAIAKHKLESRLAMLLQQSVGHYPSIYMLGIMFMGLFLSSFVSNVAAPVLLLSVVQHTLWELPTASGAPHAILLGLAMSCNFGGMLTPISSPQNAVALQVLSTSKMNISFFTWLLLAAPICILGVIIGWGVLIVVWRPFENIRFIPTILKQKSKDEEDPREMYLVIVVCALTVVLWVVQPLSDAYFGDAAMVALFPIVVFFGVGVLSKDDFNTLSWHLLFLLAGGSMLGLCAHRSHLVDVIMKGLRPFVASSPPWVVTFGIITVVAFITSFISHTVGAMILLPLVMEISVLNAALPDTRYLVFAAVTMCSGAMAFPITSFPNVNSLLAEDDMGKPYLMAKHFVVPGMIMTMFVHITLCTIMDPYMRYVLGPAPS